jgi:anti-sigma regulatory factor (Ser/Thr protein kinase)
VSGAPQPAPCLIRFSVHDLRRVRLETAQWAATTGLRSERVDDFVIAVSEIATNAVRYGSPEAQLELRGGAGKTVLAEVRDTGRWEIGVQPAEAEGHGRMGLALARRVCDEVEIRTAPTGTTVILRMNLD